jgi:TRAP-type C4-dicarboxylate transport system permease large subunit
MIRIPALRVLAIGLAFGAAALASHAQTLKLGHITPPTHVWHQVAEKIGADLRMGALFRSTVPFLLAVMAALVLIAAVPGLSTWLPSLAAR